MESARTVLMLFDNVSANYVKQLSEGAQAAAGAAGRRLRAVNLHGSSRTVAELIEDASLGAVILTPPLSDDRHVLSQIEERALPMVRIGAMLDPERGSRVVMDEYDAARAISKVLLDAGHRRIGFIKGPREHLVSIRRQNGFANALGGKALRLDPELTAQGDFSQRSGAEAAAQLLRMKPTAIFASNDDMALGVMQEAKRAGLSIPDDLSLVGFDDADAAARAHPPLTTVRQPLKEMGEAAFTLAVEHFGRAPGRGKSIEVPYEVIERASVTQPATETA